MRSKRNLNVEILRIITMLMVITLHISWQGVGDTAIQSGLYIPKQLLQGFSYCAVDVYLFIAAYYLSEQQFSWGRIVSIWFETLFYSLFIFGLCIAFGIAPFSFSGFVKACIPVAFREYGFVTYYMGMCLTAPVLNYGLRRLNKKEHLRLLVVMLLLASIYPMCTGWQYIFFSEGNCYGLSIVIYIVAAYIRKYGKTLETKTYFKWYIGCCLLQSFAGILFGIGTYFILGVNKGEGVLMHYNSPTVLLSAVCLCMGFINMKQKSFSNVWTKIILLISSSTFGVFLIHEHPLFRVFFWQTWRTVAVHYENVLIVIISIPILFLICSFADVIRQGVFKLLHINWLTKNWGGGMDSISRTIMRIIERRG